MTEPGAVTFRLLGPIEISTAGGVVTPPRPRQRAVLAYLMLGANRLVSMDSIVDAIWGEVPATTARNQVQGDISAIRRCLRQAGVTDPIGTTPTGYKLELASHQLDLAEFTGLLTSARASAKAGDIDTAAQVSRQALARWRGPALADIDAPFVAASRMSLEEKRLNATEDRVEWELQLGRHRELVAELTALAHDHPLREGITRQLALALYRSGRTVDALAALRELGSALADEHGLGPTPALAALEVAILRGDPRLDLAERRRVRPRRGGVSLPRFRRALPAPFQQPSGPADFVGREAELAVLRDILAGGARADGSCAIVSIAGMAGVGKSTLAHRAAHLARERYPDGCLYADLQRADPHTVLGSFLRALSQPGTDMPSTLDERAARFRATLHGRRVLILLENVRDETQAEPLVPTPGSALVMTSRRHVVLPGAQLLDVAGLALEEGVRLLANVAGAWRVKEEPQAAQRVVTLCGRLPLAIRIAGVRLRQRDTMRVARLAERLTDERARLDELSVAGLDVRASLAVSFEMLDEAARRLLGLFAALPFATLTPWLAARLLEVTPPEAERLLERLHAAHLVTLTAHDRYGLHDLVRLCARAEGATDVEARRLILALLAFAGRANQRLPCRPIPLPSTQDGVEDGEDGIDAVAWFEAEHTTIVTAVGLAVEHGWRDLAGQLAATLANFCMMRGYPDAWQRSHDLVLADGEAGLDADVAATLYLSLGNLYRYRDSLKQAVAALRKASRLFARGANRPGLACAVLSRGVCAQMLGRPRVVSAALRLAAGLLEEIGPTPLKGYALLMWRGEQTVPPHEAVAALSHGLDIFAATAERWGQAEAHNMLAEVLRRAGRLREAQEHAVRAVKIYAELRDPVELNLAYGSLARIYLDSGKPERARPILEGMLAAARLLRHPWGEATARRMTGHLLVQNGRPAEAVAYFEAAAAILSRMGHAAADEVRGEARWASSPPSGARVGVGEGVGQLGDGPGRDHPVLVGDPGQSLQDSGSVRAGEEHLPLR